MSDNTCAPDDVAAPDNDRFWSRRIDPPSTFNGRDVWLSLIPSVLRPLMLVSGTVLLSTVVVAPVIHDAHTDSLYTGHRLDHSVPAQALQDLLANLGTLISAAGAGGRSLNATVGVLLVAGLALVVIGVFQAVWFMAERATTRVARVMGVYLTHVAMLAALINSVATKLNALGSGLPPTSVWGVVTWVCLVGAIGARWWVRVTEPLLPLATAVHPPVGAAVVAAQAMSTDTAEQQ